MTSRSTDSSSPFNDRHGVAMPHPIGTEDLAATLFAEALLAVQTMVFNAAEKSMPSSRFLPKFELTHWDADERHACGALFADAVRAVQAEKRGRRVA